MHKAANKMKARDLTLRLKGRWQGGYGMICCPAHEDRTPSCKVSDGGSGPVFHCFAGCHWKDVRRALENRGYLKPFRPSKEALNMSPPEPTRHDPEVVKKRRWAWEIWQQTVPATGTLGEQYLRQRGILCKLHDFQPRFHPALKEPSSGKKWPALVFAYSTLECEFDGIQRIFLDPETGGKAPVKTAKMTLGTFPGSMIRLGSIQGPSETWPYFRPLGLCEGPEDGYSIMQRFGLPVWVAGGGEKIALADLPMRLERLVIFGDNGAEGERFVRKAFNAHAHKVRAIDGVPQISREFPPTMFDDFNDWHQKQPEDFMDTLHEGL